MKNRIILITVAIIVICVGAIAYIVWPRSSNESVPTPPGKNISTSPLGGINTTSSRPSQSQPTEIDVSGFLRVASERTPEGDAVVTDGSNYRIYYNQADSAFIITLLRSPVEEARIKAETDFLRFLGVSREEACRLKVSIGVPYWVDPSYSRNPNSLNLCGA